ncbi:orf 5 end undetermined [Lasius niger]|uniref:Orf 5 end undetermined n=2 Tax=Lasius TaxID=488720 RepID=A0A0J7KI41_LASNI|nr:orf 5 end undetermined [Lasius niger]
MIKLARNHFVDQGFLYNGIHITKDLLHLLLRTTASTDLRIAHQLTQHHLDVKGPQRQNVKLAAQVFSNSTAKAIQSCAGKGLAGFENCSAVVRVLEIFNK